MIMRIIYLKSYKSYLSSLHNILIEKITNCGKSELRCGTGGLVREAHNLKVAGSSPVIALFSYFSFKFLKFTKIFFSLYYKHSYKYQY